MKKQAKQFVIGVIAIALALVAGFVARNAFRKGVDMVGYAVPKTDIPPYTLLSAEMFTSRELPRALSESGAEYCADIRNLEGRMTTSRLVANLPVACAVISESQDYRLADPSLEVASFSVPASSAVGGDIEAGTNVNIYLIRAIIDDSSSRSTSSLIATVPVIKILPVETAEGEEAQVVVVVAAPSQTIQAIVGAVAKDKGEENTSLWITLAAADSFIQTTGTTNENVLDGTSNQGLDVTRADAQATLESLGFVFGGVQENTEGEIVVGAKDNYASATLYGPAEEISKVEISALVEKGGGERENSVYFIGLVKYLFPDWSQGVVWVDNQFLIAAMGTGATESYAGATLELLPIDSNNFVTLKISK